VPCAVSTHKITAMALSSKRIAAIAETADHAFVTLYNVEKRKKINTLKMPDCETIVSAAFSPDGKYLLTQGGAPTWSIVCWSVEKGKPVANTVTNTDAYKQIANVSFHPEDSDVFCVSGNGVLKFFRIGDNTIKMISNGLHKREPQNFKSHTFLTKGSLIASTGTGELILFKNFEWSRAVESSDQDDGVSIDCVLACSKGFLAGCSEGTLRLYSLHSEDRGGVYKCDTAFHIKSNSSRIVSLAISPSEDNVLCGTENAQLFTLCLSNSDIMKADDMDFEHPLTPFHGPDSEGALRIHGLDVCARKRLAVTCAADCYLRVWNFEDNIVEVQRRLDEPPVCLSVHPSGLHVR